MSTFAENQYCFNKSRSTMYEYISGEVAEITSTYAVIDAGGVGYHIVISLQTYSEIEKQKRAKLYIHFIVREDVQILYGFADRRERDLFRLLISVSGVGGNTARMVLSTYSPSEVVNIIASDNAELLRKVKGLGLKTAQKIIISLRDKVTNLLYPIDQEMVSAGAVLGAGENYKEALAALTMLGFPKNSSDKALRSVAATHPTASVEEIVRLALKSL